MLQYLYNKARVVHDPHRRTYTVEFKERFSFRWRQDCTYSYYEKEPSHNNTLDQKKASQLAKDRVDQLIDKAIIYEKSNLDYYC